MPVRQLLKGNTDVYAYFITKVAFTDPDTPHLIKPAGTYAVVYLKGNYYDAAQAYRILFDYMEKKASDSRRVLLQRGCMG